MRVAKVQGPRRQVFVAGVKKSRKICGCSSALPRTEMHNVRFGGDPGVTSEIREWSGWGSRFSLVPKCEGPGAPTFSGAIHFLGTWATRRFFDHMYCIDLSIPFSSSRIRADLPKTGIPAEGKTWRKRNVSPTLVFDYRATRRAYLEIGDARAHDPLLDNRARHRRIGPRRRHYSHGFAREKRTISSGWPDFFYTGRDPGSLHLL